MDTNILIKLFFPVGFDNRNKPYEDYYKKLLSSKCTLVLTSVQVSEFINRCIRIQHNLYITEHPDACDFKKDYRITENYAISMKAILEILKSNILTRFTIMNDDFSSIDLNQIINYNFSFDFNDAFLASFAKLHNYMILTDDKDFSSYASGPDIITNNKALLMFITFYKKKYPLFSHKHTPSGSVLLRPFCPHAALPAESRKLQTVCGTPYCLPEYANRYSSDEVPEKPRKPASLPHPVHSLCPGTFSKS